MKLLSTRETESHTIADHYNASERLSAIHSQLSREEREFELWKDTVELQKKEIKEDFDEKLLVLNDKISTLENEVSSLEKKRAALLKPLDDTPEIITKNLAVAENLLEYLRTRKIEVAEMKRVAADLTIQSEKRLQELLEKENRLNGRNVQIEKRTEAVKTQELLLAESVEKFSTEANRRNIGLMLFENKLNKQEVELAEREKMIAHDKEKIAQDRKRVESQQQSLIAAMAEAQNKKLI